VAYIFEIQLLWKASFVGKKNPNIFSKNLSFLIGSLSSTFPGAMTKLSNLPLSLTTMCNLKP
jgi:hypothetical protein